MGQQKYPPLTLSDIKKILAASGFNHKRTTGSHHQYERAASEGRKRCVVTLDEAVREFSGTLLKSVIAQSGMPRDQFYGSLRRAAAKAGL